MKIISIVLMAVAVAFNAPASDVWFKNVSVGAVGAVRQADFASGHSELGGGVEMAIPVSKSRDIKLTGRVLTFEEAPDGSEGDKWEGDVVDEIAIGARFLLLSSENKAIRLEGSAGGDRSQQLDDFGFHVGLALRWSPTKSVGLSIGREIRTWFKNDHDHLSYGAIEYTF